MPRGKDNQEIFFAATANNGAWPGKETKKPQKFKLINENL